MKTFLKYFIAYIIEAVGGYKDYENDGISKEFLARVWDVPRSEPSSTATSPEKYKELVASIESKNQSITTAKVKGNDSPNIANQKTPGEEFTEGEIFAFDNAPQKDIEQTSLDSSIAKLSTKGSSVAPQPISVPSSCDNTEISFSPVIEVENRTKCKDGNISQIAFESVIWLSHRLGPVLSAKYLSRNLLKMLNLCYIGPDGFIQTHQKYQDQSIRISRLKIKGDVLADKVLESLTGLVSLYGEQLILLQYLPYAWDLISLCRKRRGEKLTPNLEGGLLGCMALVHHVIPYLSSDSVLMNELSDGLLARVLFPFVQIATSRSLIFTGGWKPRKILIYKLLDVVYLIGLRIGEEMARAHLTPICSALLAAFDKAYDPCGKPLKADLYTPEEEENGGINHSSSTMLLELSQVLVPDLAYDAYVTFYHLVGRAHLDSNIPNLDLIQILCLSFNETHAVRPATFAHFRHQHTSTIDQDSPSPLKLACSSGSKGGNMISVSSDSTNMALSNQMPSSYSKPDGCNRSSLLHSLIAKEVSNTGRHLKGNWLAYWEHEIGRSESDQQFVLKQILLQSFVGHSSGGVKLHVLDNENSFLSGGGPKDRTVKVWSIRSQGDGTSAVAPQWTYSLHKKAINNVLFLDGLRLAVSCDTAVHVWDPFVGSGILQVDSSKLGSVSVMATHPSDGHFPAAGIR